MGMISIQARLWRPGQRLRIFFAMVLVVLLFVAIVEGFVVVSRQPARHQSLCATIVSESDIDIVGEGRRGDAKGAALRLEDVAVSRGGSTLLSSIDWRVEPTSKWALVVRIKASKYFIVI